MDAQHDMYFAHQVLGTLFAVTNKIQMRGDKYLKDLSVRQMKAMGAIIHLPAGKATINNIARFMGTTKQSAKQIVDIMAKKQYLSTSPSERDKRAVNVAITPQGEQIIRTCSERNNEFVADIFQEFTTEDLETLWALLKKLYRFDGTAQVGFEESMNYYTKPQEQSQLPKKEDQ
jgi:DNA-binding MarR family transcriptional regulator